MHTTFALGWFLLIVVGWIETMVYFKGENVPLYVDIFFSYYVHPIFEHNFNFSLIKDALLLLLLIGVGLALFKRIRSRAMGMKRTTKHTWGDRVALSALWLIFPARLLAESMTSAVIWKFGGIVWALGEEHHLILPGIGCGSFLTNSTGEFLARVLPPDILQAGELPAWWFYSITLCVFFVALPFSRYMHIFTEIPLIFLRNAGLRSGEKVSSYDQFQTHACSRCGICIDPCQLQRDAGIKGVQAVYFLRDRRSGKLTDQVADNCLMCGRCENSCPVGINLNAIRQSKRPDILRVTKETYAYVPQPEVKPAKVAYFAGCMSHLTPGIIKSMQQIFEKAKADYTFIDEKAGVCCGRPLALSGNWKAAQVVMDKNLQMIDASQADILVTSCPICYKTFKEDYLLNIKIMHHTEYIDMLIREGKLKVNALDLKTVFHNPCELGRGCGVVDAPENVLKQVSQKIPTAYDGKKSLCCGGSLANTAIDATQKTKISSDTVKAYAAYQPDVIVTACPLCKKTLGKTSLEIPVKDIAELVAEA